MKKINLMERFTFKNILLDAIKQRLEGTGITKMILIFNITNNTYNVMLQNENNSSMKLNIEKDDVTKLKFMFVDKIIKKYYEMNTKEIKSLIIQINLSINDIQLFTQDLKDNIEAFSFKQLTN